jgi:arylsulfatase A-like enzyme
VKPAEVWRWFLPTVTAASSGALVSASIEATRGEGLGVALCAAGFVALLMFPLLVLLHAAARGVWRAWQPHELSLVESDGAAPRFAAWLLVFMLGCAALMAIVFFTTQRLADSSAFSPLVVSYVDPAVAVVSALVLLALSRPLVRVLMRVLRSQRWLTVRRIVGLVVGGAVLAVGLSWVLVIAPALGPLDLGMFLAPIAGIAVSVLVHWSTRVLPRMFAVISAALLLCCVLATFVIRFVDPPTVLSVWGDMPVAGFVVELVFDLESIREDIPQSEYRPLAVPGARHRDIIVVTIDTVRADHTPPYGGHAEMPTLAALANHGTVFEWAFSPSNVTRRSIPSMMIGLQPNRVRGRVIGWALRVDPRYIMLAERMRAGGYETAGFMCCDGFWGKKFHTGLDHGLEHLEIDHNGLALARRAHAWLSTREQAHPTKPLFMWMHILEPHNWGGFGPEPHTDAERSATYDRALAACDTMLKEVLTSFADRPPDDMPIVIVTADHGEALGEHGQPFHSTDLYNSQIHVPLVISGPPVRASRVGETVSLIALAPTVLALAGFSPDAGAFDDGPFAALATGDRAPDPEGGEAFTMMVKDRSNPGGMAAVVAGKWKLIDDHGTLRLFDVHADPHELTDLAATRPPVVERLRVMLQKRLSAGHRSPFEQRPRAVP